MKDQAATALQPAREMMTPLKPFTSAFCEKVKEINNSIARRAFEMFESNGQTVGRELEHWLKAETEVLHPTHLEIAESDEALTVRAEMPGFSGSATHNFNPRSGMSRYDASVGSSVQNSVAQEEPSSSQVASSAMPTSRRRPASK